MSTTICDLPPEVVGYVFDFLDYDEIQHVRLVCKTWYEITMESRYLDREIVEYVDSSYDVCFKEWFCKTTRRFFHVKIPWDFTSSVWRKYWFWRKVVVDVRTLSVGNHTIPTRKLMWILRRTKQLRVLNLDHCELSGPHQLCGKDLDLQLPALEEIWMHYHPSISENFLESLAKAAPNLKKFAISYS